MRTIASVAMLFGVLTRAMPVQAELGCTIRPQWVWDGDVEAPDTAWPCVSPLVVQLTDDDGDGQVDSRDMPDVVLIHYKQIERDTQLTAVDGRTGREHFRTTRPVRRIVAAADIDGDGLVELVALDRETDSLVAFENDGTFKWKSDPSPVPFLTFDMNALGIADLDQDGSPELFIGSVVWGADGSFLWDGEGGRGRQVHGDIAHAVDLMPSNPGLELVAGNTAYDASGNILWQNRSASDGWTAIADLDGDGDAEVVVVWATEVYLLDHLGNELAPVEHFGSGPASQPVAADLDGDGDAEVFLMSTDDVRALDWTGSEWQEMWVVVTNDFSSNNGGAAFDFDLDGRAELLYHDMEHWYVLDGLTGAILHQEAFPSATGIETPVVADIDGDCRTEILVSGCRAGSDPSYPNEVRAYECDAPARARPLWNQYAYHATNIDDEGTVPLAAVAPWTDGLGWLQQSGVPGGTPPVADAGAPQELCEGDAAVLDGSLSTGCAGTLEYRWLEGFAEVCAWSVDPSCPVAPTEPQSTYTLEVRCDGSECVDAAVTTIDLLESPTADAGPTQLVCEGEPVVLDGGASAGCASGYEYRWLDGGVEVCGWSADPLCAVDPTEPQTTYTLEVRCTASGCVDTSETVVDRSDNPTADAGLPQVVCSGDPSELGGSPTASGGTGPYQYMWTSLPPGLIAPGEETLPNPVTVALTAPAQFTVVVLDANGCSQSSAVAVDVSVPNLPDDIGNTVRAVRDRLRPDVILSWSTSDPDTEAFRPHRGWPKASSYPVYGTDLTLTTLTDPNVIGDGASYAYELHGVNCAGVEGP